MTKNVLEISLSSLRYKTEFTNYLFQDSPFNLKVLMIYTVTVRCEWLPYCILFFTLHSIVLQSQEQIGWQGLSLNDNGCLDKPTNKRIEEVG